MSRVFSEPLYLHVPMSSSAYMADLGIALTSVKLYLPSWSGEAELGVSPSSKLADMLISDNEGRVVSQLVVCSKEDEKNVIEAISESVLNRRLEEAGAEGISVGYDGETVDLDLIDIDFGTNPLLASASSEMLELRKDIEAACCGQAVIIRGISDTKATPFISHLMNVCHASPCFVIVSEDNYNAPGIREMVIRNGYEVCFLPSLTEDDYSDLLIRYMDKTAYEFASDITPGVLYRMITGAFGHAADSELLDSIFERMEKCAMKRWVREQEEWERDETKLPSANEITVEDVQSALLMNEKNPRMNGGSRSLSDYSGLDEVKKLTERIIAIELEKRRNPMLGDIRTNIILLGDPGTGKTTSARLIYEELKANNIITGPWVYASRKDLIGKFVGETAHKVTKMFEQARHGVLFVDESGFFLEADEPGNGGLFLREAIKEFVRFMENEEDVIVIFGMYSSEKDAFLKLDDGLASRIHHFVELKCSEEQLITIFKDMVRNKGYKLGEEAAEEALSFFREQKKRAGAGFGNAREARRLQEASVVELCLRRSSCGQEADDASVEIIADDIKKAASRLLAKEKPEKCSIGF